MVIGCQSKQFALQLPLNCAPTYLNKYAFKSNKFPLPALNWSKHYLLIRNSLFLIRATGSKMEGKKRSFVRKYKNMPNGLPRTWSFYGLFIINQKWTWTVGAFLEISKMYVVHNWARTCCNYKLTPHSPYLSPNFAGDLLPVKSERFSTLWLKIEATFENWFHIRSCHDRLETASRINPSHPIVSCSIVRFAARKLW